MNTIDDALKAFSAAADSAPMPALKWALSHWDEAAPRCLALLDAYTDGTDQSQTTLDAMVFVVHLLGDRADTRAYRTLCRLLLDEEKLTNALGDEACVSTLKGILSQCFDGVIDLGGPTSDDALYEEHLLFHLVNFGAHVDVKRSGVEDGFALLAELLRSHHGEANCGVANFLCP